jgi:hypothetical protein
MYNFFHFFLYCAAVAAVLTIVWKCTFAPYDRIREEGRFTELSEDKVEQHASGEEFDDTDEENTEQDEEQKLSQ